MGVRVEDVAFVGTAFLLAALVWWSEGVRIARSKAERHGGRRPSLSDSRA